MRSREPADRNNDVLGNFGHDTDNLLRCASFNASPEALTHSDSSAGNYCQSSDSTNQWEATNRVTCGTSQDRDSPWPFNFLTLGHLQNAQQDSHLPTDIPSPRRACHLAICISPDNLEMMNLNHMVIRGRGLSYQGFQCIVHLPVLAGCCGLLDELHHRKVTSPRGLSCSLDERKKTTDNTSCTCITEST